MLTLETNFLTMKDLQNIFYKHFETCSANNMHYIHQWNSVKPMAGLCNAHNKLGI